MIPPVGAGGGGSPLFHQDGPRSPGPGRHRIL